MDILEKTRNKVLETLKRDQPLWRVKNTCPTCSYKLHNEKELILKTLVTMDGNNSLKRLRRDGAGKEASDAQQSRCALPDSRSAPGDYYLSRAEVDAWSKDAIKKDRMNRQATVNLDAISFLSVCLCAICRAMTKKLPVQVGGATWTKN